MMGEFLYTFSVVGSHYRNPILHTMTCIQYWHNIHAYSIIIFKIHHAVKGNVLFVAVAMADSSECMFDE